MLGAAGCEGWVAGSGKERKKETTGSRVVKREVGNGALRRSAPGGGVDPDEPSATSLVYIWVSFFAPVSTRRAFEDRLG